MGWDKLGIALSMVYLVHCLMLPLVIAELPFMTAQWPEASEFHVVSALALVPVALLAMMPGLRVHRRRSVAAAMAAGLSRISTAAFAGERLLSQEWSTRLTVAGGASLVTAHAVNLLLCRKYLACATHAHDAPHP